MRERKNTAMGFERPRNKEVREKSLPDFDIDLENEADFEEKMTKLAWVIYDTLPGRRGKYDPYNRDMLCGEITEIFLDYLAKKDVPAYDVDRYYDFRMSDGSHIESFGHVYFMVEAGKEQIMVDPTYLQWIPEEMRSGLPPIFFLRFTDREDFEKKFFETALGAYLKSKTKGIETMILPFYLGFDDANINNLAEEQALPKRVSDDVMLVDILD